MTARQFLHDLSSALLSDERVLSPREKQLLSSLLQQAARVPQDGVLPETIARSVGEVVAQRAYWALGSSIAEQLLGRSETGARAATAVWARSPEPPSPKPSPHPSPNVSPEPPSPKPSPHPSPNVSPEPPSPKPSPHPSPNISPEPPSPKMFYGQELSQASRAQLEDNVAVLEIPQIASARCVVLDEFLAPAELNQLTQFTLEREADFKVSEVVSPGVTGGAADFDYRRSHVLMDLGKHEEIIVNRIQACLPRIVQQLGCDPFRISRVEAQITASGDGDFFRWHTDDGQAEIATRHITFVYFFHREPKAFRGGELRIYDSEWRDGSYRPTENYRNIVPRQNQAVFFASMLAHEITPVECPSHAFADSRFTVNGWFHR